MNPAHSQRDETDLQSLLESLYDRYGYDFRDYAAGCMRRRMGLARHSLGCQTFSELRDKLMQDESALDRVLSYATVQVSEMFRDPGFFLALRRDVLPRLQTYPSLRVWVAGCGNGEELYSLAILFREEGLESRTRFYATDIDRRALERAEAGVYPVQRLPLYTASHRMSGAPCSLSEYYVAGARAAVFDKTLRRSAVFADHSLVSDSVFAEVHLVVCRNVLIYFQPGLQDRAISLFRDSLVRFGFLGLGAQETLRFSAHASSFREFAADWRIYQKRGEA